MDPITALGIAGSVVQLVDFGIKVVSKSKKIYRSGDGTLERNHDLESVASDLLVIQTKLRQSLRPLESQGPLSEDDHALVKLSESSSDVASELLERLNKAKVEGRFQRWKSVRQAVKSITSKKDVDELADRLMTLRGQLDLRIVIGLRHRVDIVALQQSEAYQLLDQASKRILQALEDNTNVFTDIVERHKATMSEKHNPTDELLTRIGDNIIASLDRHVRLWEAQPGKSGPDTQGHGSFQAASYAILRSLSYSGMEERHLVLAGAHARTFQWIFQDAELHEKPWDDFTSWLSSQDDIYWISGKAASGKSTLIKYITDHPDLSILLAPWANNTQLVYAHHFFWNVGTSIQKSQAGLLRSLLHQILSQLGYLIPDSLPQLWTKVTSKSYQFLLSLQESWHPWSLIELRKMLEDVFSRTMLSVKFCLFIDGLDEFAGDHSEIASFVREMANFPNVKLCVSSRPLMAFEQEFETCHSLCLQDLTVQDTTLFVNDRLKQHRRISELHDQEPGLIGELITEIVEMSSGVFLWVALVTKSLLQGLTDLNEVSDLQKRLRELPPELDDLFSHMIESISSKMYQEQASRLFQLVYHSLQPITSIELSFADDDDDQLALRAKIGKLSEKEAAERHKRMATRLKSRCAGLLECSSLLWVPGHHHIEVRYLHLSVKEFLEKPDVWRMLLASTASTKFCAHLSLLRASVLFSKYSCRDDYLQRALDAMTYAARAENSTKQPNIRLLNELDRTLHTTTRSFVPDTDTFGKCHWSRQLLDGYPIDLRETGDSFLALAISTGLLYYVKAAVGHGEISLTCKGARSWLELAIPAWDTMWAMGAKQQPLQLSLPMIDFLLRSGADPNHQFLSSTPWLKVLTFLLQNHLGIDACRIDLAWLDVCKLFLCYGARPQESLRLILLDGEAVSMSALDIVLRAFAHLPLELVADLKTMFIQGGAQQFDRNKAGIRSADSRDHTQPPKRYRPLNVDRNRGRSGRHGLKRPNWSEDNLHRKRNPRNERGSFHLVRHFPYDRGEYERHTSQSCLSYEYPLNHDRVHARYRERPPHRLVADARSGSGESSDSRSARSYDVELGPGTYREYESRYTHFNDINHRPERHGRREDRFAQGRGIGLAPRRRRK